MQVNFIQRPSISALTIGQSSCDAVGLLIIEPVREKTNNLGYDQVRHKPGCTVTEDG